MYLDEINSSQQAAWVTHPLRLMQNGRMSRLVVHE
jgi:hypothetical protein